MISKKVSSRRKELGLSQADLARAVGVSRGSVNKWEKGDISIKSNNLPPLAKALKCDVNWLLNGQESPDPKTAEPSNVEKGPKLQGSYPVISWVQAGDWSQIFEANRVEADHYPCPVKCSKQTFLLKVCGMSMSPLFNEGELIFIDPDVEPTNGKYVIARLDGENEATFKQLIIESGHKFLKAANPNWPTQIQPINGDCTIVGVVISAMRLF
jgi:SOS-response transcriptional repressor LexA